MKSPARRRTLLLSVPALVGALALSACASGATSPGTASSGAASAGGSPAASAAASGAASSAASPSAAPSPSGVPAATSPVTKTKVGVSVTGKFGDKPALTVPSTSAPTELSKEVLTEGTGPVVQKGQVLVANYLGETWAPKDGQPNIFDNSWDRLKPASFGIGTGEVIKGWDNTLVGLKAGSRVLLTIPPADGYGTATTDGSGLGGQTLLFVVDVLGSLDKTAAASGDLVTSVPADFPKVTNESGKEPAVTSVEGIKPGADARSTLLIKGTGAAIDPAKTLALQLVQTDTATGKQTQKTWGQAISLVPAKNVLTAAKALEGQKVGSRALVVSPEQGGNASVVLVIDVVGQY